MRFISQSIVAMTNKIGGFEKVLSNLSEAEKSKLTKLSEAYFKIVFDYQLEPRYNFSSINTVFHPDCYGNGKSDRTLVDTEKLELFSAFSKFVEDCVQLTYNQVEEKYGGHPPDSDDKKINKGGECSVFHYQMATNGLGKTARIHGYIKDGYFVVIRMDWSHSFHVKDKR